MLLRLREGDRRAGSVSEGAAAARPSRCSSLSKSTKEGEIAADTRVRRRPWGAPQACVRRAHMVGSMVSSIQTTSGGRHGPGDLAYHFVFQSIFFRIKYLNICRIQKSN